MVGIKQKYVMEIVNRQGFITPKELKKIYQIHSIAINGIRTLEIMGLVVWNEKLLRWDKIEI